MKVLFADVTGLAATTYGVVRRKSDGFYRRASTGAFEAYNAANFADYDHPVTESPSTGHYAMTFPAVVETGGYHVFILRQAGANPTPGDEVLWEELVWWNGAEATPPPPSGSTPGRVTGYLYTYNEFGTIEAGVAVTVQVAGFGSSDAAVDLQYGYALDSTLRVGTSDGAGLVEFPNLFKGVNYTLRRGDGTAAYTVEIPSDATDPYELPSIIGAP